jgi:hypothetical protein
VQEVLLIARRVHKWGQHFYALKIEVKIVLLLARKRTNGDSTSEMLSPFVHFMLSPFVRFRAKSSTSVFRVYYVVHLGCSIYT